MKTVKLAELPESVQAFARSIQYRETMLVTDEDGTVVANITAIPVRRAGADEAALPWGSPGSDGNEY